MSMLHSACLVESINLARLLLKCDANVNIHARKWGTPLHQAVSHNHKSIVQLLIDNDLMFKR
jgi:ankyrin repeat protein